MEYKYQIYGLNVVSNLSLNCFAGDFITEDVRITCTPEYRIANALKAAFCSNDIDKLTLPYDMGTIFICGISELIVYYQSEADLSDISMFLLGFTFSYLLVKRKIFTFHGNTIIHKGKGLMFLGESGSGKSSLSAGYLKAGDKMISDDISKVDLMDTHAVVCPSYPSIKLWKTTSETLGFDLRNALEVFNQKNKFQLSSAVLFSSTAAPLTAMIYIVPADTERVTLVRENAFRSVRILTENVYNFRIATLSAYKSSMSQFIIQLLEIVPVYTLRRPRNTFTVQEQMDVIERTIFEEDIA